MSELIISNPKIMMGKPVIKETRITVELILENLAAFCRKLKGLGRFFVQMLLRDTHAPAMPLA